MLNGRHVEPGATLAAPVSTDAAEALLELGYHLAVGCGRCRAAVDSLPDAVVAAAAPTPIVAALRRLREPATWATLTSDHFAAASEARHGEAWGAFADLVAEEALLPALANPRHLLGGFDQLVQLGERLAERHPEEPRVAALRSKTCAFLVPVYCGRGNLAAAGDALVRAAAFARRSGYDTDTRLHLHEAFAMLAWHRRQPGDTYRHLLRAIDFTGRPLKAFELIVEIELLLANQGAVRGAGADLLQRGLAALEPLQALADPIARANLLLRKARLLAVLAHRRARLGGEWAALPLRRVADELAAADELFRHRTDRQAQGLRLLVLGQLWALGRAERCEAAFRAALEIFEEAGAEAYAAEAREALADLDDQLATGSVN